MKIKDKGIFKIEYDKSNDPIVIFKPVNGTIWLNKAELAELFGVSIQLLDSPIKEFYNTKTFEHEITCNYHLYTDKNTIKYEAAEFNLQVIIALAFRINSWEAKLIREWIIRKVVKGHFCMNPPIFNEKQQYSLN